MKVVICGAGIAGLSLAWWLGKQDWQVLVVEKASWLRDEGYMIDFFGPGYDAAERMGLLPLLQEAAYIVPELVYVDERGKRVAGLDYELFRRMQSGRLLSLMRGDLERILFEALPGEVEIRYGCTIDSVAQDGDHVEMALSDGSGESANLLVGADGVHSRVRELVFGAEEGFIRHLGLHTAAYIFEDAKVQESLAGNFKMLSVPDRQFGLYAIRGGRIASFFVHRTPDATPDDACGALHRIYGDLGWLAPATLPHCGETCATYYDQVAQVEMLQWSKDRVTLVGDACQAVSLLAGQGASLAMLGALVLADELGKDRPVEESLAQYEARLQPVIAKKQKEARKFVGWFVPASRWRIAARNVALRVAGLSGMGWVLRGLGT